METDGALSPEPDTRSREASQVSFFIVINALLYQVQSHGIVAASDGELAGEILERVCAAFKHSFKGHLSGNGLAVAVAACDSAVYYSGAQD